MKFLLCLYKKAINLYVDFEISTCCSLCIQKFFTVNFSPILRKKIILPLRCQYFTTFICLVILVLFRKIHIMIKQAPMLCIQLSKEFFHFRLDIQFLKIILRDYLFKDINPDEYYTLSNNFSFDLQI